MKDLPLSRTSTNIWKPIKMTQASICTIGDEILIGQIVDTNSSHISQSLNTLGIRVTRMLSIGDEHDVIVDSLTGELEKNDIVIVTQTGKKFSREGSRYNAPTHCHIMVSQ